MSSLSHAPTGAAEPARPLRRPRLLAVVAAGALLVVAASWRWLGPQATPAPRPAPFTAADDHVEIAAGSPTWSYLTLETAALGDPIAPEPVPGRVAFDETRSEPVVAPLAGRVDVVTVRLGQRVESGDRLLAIRSPALVDLFKEIDLLESKVAAREKNVARLRALVALKAEPEKDLVAAEQELRQSELAREAAELKLKSLSVAGAGQGLYWLTASRAGVVVERSVLAGQEVGPDRADPLLVVADLAEVIVTADVPEGQVGSLRVGETARVVPSAAPDRGLDGHVEYVGEVVDPLRRMVEVRVRVANPSGALRPNAFVEVAFPSDGAPRVVVPASAIVSDDQRAFVFVRRADRPGTLERRAVTVGHQRAGRAEVVDGLAAGETYVGKGAILLLNAIDLARE